MTLYAGSQLTVNPPYVAYSGDFAPGGAPTVLAPVQGYYAAAPCLVGSFVFVDANNQINPLPVSGSRLAGILARTQNSVFPFSQTLQGYGMTVGAGSRGDVVRLNCGQDMYVQVTSLNSGGSINLGDGVYVNNTTGVTEVSTSSPGAGHTATGYIVVSTQILTSSSETVVQISSTSQV